MPFASVTQYEAFTIEKKMIKRALYCVFIKMIQGF